mgnify:CR=1 FL=1
MSFNPSDEKPLSAYTNEELLGFLGIESTLKDVFRNYNMTDEEKREFLLEKAQEKNQKYIWQGFRTLLIVKVGEKKNDLQIYY